MQIINNLDESIITMSKGEVNFVNSQFLDKFYRLLFKYLPQVDDASEEVARPSLYWIIYEKLKSFCRGKV
jgi:hypothetical protein